MELTRLVTSLERLDEVPSLARGRTLAVSFAPDDSVVALGSLAGRIEGPIGIWLEVSADYPAQMAARDVATLSWMVELDNVVVASEVMALEYAEVVRVLLSDDEVNFSNAAATLRAAYNRPAPPRPVRVWSFDGTTLSTPDREALRASSSDAAPGETLFV